MRTHFLFFPAKTGGPKDKTGMKGSEMPVGWTFSAEGSEAFFPCTPNSACNFGRVGRYFILHTFEGGRCKRRKKEHVAVCCKCINSATQCACFFAAADATCYFVQMKVLKLVGFVRVLSRPMLTRLRTP